MTHCQLFATNLMLDVIHYTPGHTRLINCLSLTMFDNKLMLQFGFAYAHTNTHTHTHTHTQCCIQLSQGSLTPAQLTKDVLSLVATRSPRHLSDPTLSLQDTLHNKPSMEIIKMLNQLSDRAIYAQACCSIILVCFKLALVSILQC